MAEECSESSVATQLNWWDNPSNNNFHFKLNQNPNSISSSHFHHHHPHVSLSTSSFTDASVLTFDSSNLPLQHHPSDTHLWTQVLQNIENGVELQNNDHYIGENFLDAVSSSRSVSPAGMFEPAACSDYLKKMDSTGIGRNNGSWPETFSSFDGGLDTQKHVNALIGGGGGGDRNLFENERFSKLSNLVGTWSIALPSSFPIIGEQTFSSYGHDLKSDIGCGGLFRRSFAGINGGNMNGYHTQIGSKLLECHGMQVGDTNTRNFADYISFNSRLGKPPLININGSNTTSNFRSLNLSADGKKQIHQNPSPTRSSGRGSGVTNEGKKKRSEEPTETALKKPKQHNSAPSSTKTQQPKVKIGDRITALQQIVSPFGKTDTASVLTDTIGYIKFLQEQVQLLSNPYMKTNCYKDPWQSLDRKDSKLDAKIDLRSRGLCLVPISCTPQVYRENTGSDYWTPYRGCFYR